MRINNTEPADNLTDVLTKIYEFTVERNNVLMANLENASKPGYMPLDMPVEEFASIMDVAVSEHCRSKRLVFCDSRNVKFKEGTFCDARPAVDAEAVRLLTKDKNEFLELQLRKLSENTLNQKIACELLKQKQGVGTILSTMEL